MRSLWDSTGSYAYFGDYLSLPIRPSGISNFIDVTFDSASYVDSTRMLCLSGQVMEYGSRKYMSGVQVVVGTFLRLQGQLIQNDTTRPTPAPHFRMVPEYEDSTDSEGRFSLCTRIDSSSSLMIATKGYYLELYKVGKLVDSAWTQ